MLIIYPGGKTTLFKTLVLGENVPSKGSASVSGLDCVADAFSIGQKALVGYVPQQQGLLEYLTVEQSVGLFRSLRSRPCGFGQCAGTTLSPAGAGCCCCCCCGGGGGGDGAAELSDEVMSTRYLKYPAFALSGGNKRKLAVVLANTGCPDLLLLDEPTTGFISPFNSQFVCL